MSTGSTSSRSSTSTHDRQDSNGAAAQPPRRERERRPSTSKRLAAMATQQLRSSQFGPNFLQDIARKGMPVTYDKSRDGKFRVVTGAEAAELAQSVLGRKGSGNSRKHHQQPVVLALPRPVEAGRKAVDLWRSWRGHTGTHRKQGTGDLIGDEFDKHDKLDKAFDKALKTLEREYKRQSVLSIPSNDETLGRSNSRKSDRSDSTSRSHKSACSNASVNSDRQRVPGTPDQAGDVLAELPVPNSKSLSSFGKTNSSVASLPLLNMMPNVPLSHQPKLRVVNPDSSSQFSSNASRTHGSSAPRSSRRRYNSEAPTPSAHVGHRVEGTPLRRSSSDTPDNGSEELLIVLVDENTAAWHGLERRASTRSTPTRNAVRESPWNGPLARSPTAQSPHGASRRRYEVPLQQSIPDSDEDEDDTSEDEYPVIPMKELLALTGRIPPAYPASYASPPVVPLNMSLSGGSASAPVIPNYSPYSTGSSLSAGSPFIPTYSTPQTPLQPLSATYPYAHPYAGIPL